MSLSYRIKNFLRINAKWIYTPLYRLKKSVKDRKFRERKVRYGSLNKDKKIYLIRFKDYKSGLMNYVGTVWMESLWAEHMGYVPVVDMCNYANTYLDADRLGKENSWEYYFTQPGGVSLDDAYKSCDVLLNKGEGGKLVIQDYIIKDGHYTPENSNELFELIKRIRINSELKTTVDQEYKTKFPKGGKVLGVICRQTDIIGCSGHSIQPTVEELIEIVKEDMESYDAKHIFLASDTEDAIRKFKHYFGESAVITNSAQRFDDFKKITHNSNSLGDVHFKRENDGYLKGFEYLVTILLLSKCDYLTGTQVGALYGALSFNMGNYKNVHIIDKGKYRGKN